MSARVVQGSRAEVLMRDGLWVLPALCGCADGATGSWTSPVLTEEFDGLSLSQHVDLEVREDGRATLASRGIVEDGPVASVEVTSEAGTWEETDRGWTFHVPETVIPNGGVFPETTFDCEPDGAALACDLGEPLRFEPRDDPAPDEVWTLLSTTTGGETTKYPSESTRFVDGLTFGETYAGRLEREGDVVVQSFTEALHGNGAVHSTEERITGTWEGDALRFGDEVYDLDCVPSGDRLRCAATGWTSEWERAR